MKHFLAWLRAQFARVMHIEDTTVRKYTIEDMEDFLHRSGVVFVAAMELRQGIDDDQGWLQVGHNLYQIRDIIRVIDDIKGSAQVRRIEDDEIPMIRLWTKGR